MAETQCEFTHTFNDINQLTKLLNEIGATLAVIKKLPKKANEKNQVRIASTMDLLHSLFSLTFYDRGQSSSIAKQHSDKDKNIVGAVFDDFRWLTVDHRFIRAPKVKAILYPQYPEVRLSAFKTEENTMPRAISSQYSGSENMCSRVLVLAQMPGGGATAIMIVAPNKILSQQIDDLSSFNGSRKNDVCKKLLIKDNSSKLASLLRNILGNTYDGCRNNKHGTKIPFTGSQVCGYTLEQLLDIIPNSNRDGDIFGIELKAYSQKKVTLFTPEPDFGLYADNYTQFMQKHGYPDVDGNLRFTGIHKANKQHAKSKLKLKIIAKQYVHEKKQWFTVVYDPHTSSTLQMQSFDVVLIDDLGEIAAGWSYGRLNSCWGAKHNEAVYVPAVKQIQTDVDKRKQGYEFQVTFGPQVMWCKTTSADRLFRAIYNGTIFLDPAPKLNLTDPSKNKRRSQWRVNNITSAAYELYDEVVFTELPPAKL